MNELKESERGPIHESLLGLRGQIYFNRELNALFKRKIALVLSPEKTKEDNCDKKEIKEGMSEIEYLINDLSNILIEQNNEMQELITRIRL